MKKSLLFLISILTSLTIQAVEYEDSQGCIYDYNQATHTATLKDGTSCSVWKVDIGSITVPDVGDFSVTSIDEGAFKDNGSIKYVVIKNVSSIGKDAFNNCSSLQLIDLPNTLSSIGDNAFKSCGRLAHIHCEDNDPKAIILEKLPTTLNQNNFATLYVPNGRKSYYTANNDCRLIFGERIFEGNMNVFQSDNMTFVGANVNGSTTGSATLLWGTNITDDEGKIIVHDVVNYNNVNYSVNTIGNSAFYDDNNSSTFSNIKSIVIKNGVSLICNKVFYNCSGLETVSLPDNLSKIGESAFQKCSKLELLTLPASLRSVGNKAFVDCGNLKHVWCKVENVDDITVVCDAGNKNYSFPTKTANPMMTFYVPSADYANDTWKTFFNEDRIFVGDMLTGDLYFGDNKFTFVCVNTANDANKQATLLRCTASGNGTGIVDKNVFKVTGIDKEAFKNQSGIIELTIPEYVTTIGANAFSGCSGLVRVVSKAVIQPDYSGTFNNARYLYVPDGSNYNWSGFALTMKGVPTPYSSDGWNYIYSSESLEAVLTGCSSEISESTDLDIPASLGQYKVVAIDNSAFKNAKCSKLTFLDEQNAASLVILGNAFSSCANLRIVDLPTRLGKIYGSAFSSCNNLNHVICRSTEPEAFASNAFPSNSNATLYVTQSNDGWNSLFSNVVLFEEIEVFENNADTYAGTYIGWTKGQSKTARLVKGVPNGSFLEISESVKSYPQISIGVSAFQGKTDIKKIRFPNSLTSIGNKAFSGCTNIADIEIERQNPFSINSDVFSNYEASLYVPEGKTESYLQTTGWAGFKIENTYEGLKQEWSDANSIYTLVYGSKGTKAKLTKLKINKEEVTIPYKFPIPKQDSNDEITLEVKKIRFESNGLSNKTSLKKLTFDEGIEIIGENSFKGCSNLKEIKLPSSITYMGDFAFDECPIITIVSKIPENALKPVGTVFYNIINPDIYIPENSTSVYETVWSIFTKFTEGDKDNCPDDKDNNMRYEFMTYNTTAILTHVLLAPEKGEIKIPSTVSIKGVDYTVTGVRDNALKNTSNKSSINNLVIDENIKTIGANAFDGCSGLKKVWLPSTLEDIGADAFKGCTSITHIGCLAENLPAISETSFPSLANTAYLLVPDGSKADYENSTYWQQGKKVFGGEFINETTLSEIPLTFICLKHKSGEGENVTITQTAILTKSKTTTKDVEIPSSVRYDGEDFDVTIIDESAFNGSSNLENLTIPESIESIGDNAFSACVNLANVTCKILSPLSISNNVFYKSSERVPAALYVEKGAYDEYKEDNVNTVEWQKFLSIHNGVRKVYENPSNGLNYEYATGETNATLIKTEASTTEVIVDDVIKDMQNGNKNVTAIAKSAFSSNSNKSITVLTIPNTVEIIGDNAFSGCSGLIELTLPSSITYLGTGAFCNSLSLKTVYCDIEANNDALIEYKDNVFPTSFNASPEIFVPKSSWSVYTIQTGWKEYKSFYIKGRRIINTPAADYPLFSFEFMTGYNTATLTNVTSIDGTEGEDGLVTIPGEVHYKGELYNVTAIGNNIFKNVDKTKIKKLNIQENIKTIHANAFDGCSGLKKIWLPKSLTRIEDNAFKGCNSITHIGCMADMMPTISQTTFPKYTAYLIVSAAIKGDYLNDQYWQKFADEKAKVFGGKFIDETTYKNLNYICLESENVVVERTAVLTSTATEESVVSIPSVVPLGEYNYKVNTIAESAFSGNKKMEALALSDNIVLIDSKAFMGCEKLVEIKLPPTLKTLGDNAFQGCASLKRIWLPSGIETMGSLPFEECVNITHVCIADANASYKNEDVFPASAATLYVPNKNTYSGWTSCFSKILDGYLVGVVNLPVKGEQNTNLGEMTFDIVDDVTNSTSAILTKSTTTSTDVIIPAAVEFGNDSYDVKVVRESVFSNNTSLINLTIRDGVQGIEANAFQNCSNLKILSLPASLESIGDNAFDGCTSLEIIENYITNPFEISNNVFPDVVASLYVPKKDKYSGATNWKKNYILLEGNRVVTDPIDGLVYEYASGEPNATLISGVPIDGNVTIPTEVPNTGKKVVAIASNAFQYCTNLKTLTLPASLESIGDNAFDGCTNLEIIENHITNPFGISSSVFPDVPALLYVPEKSYYNDAVNWIKNYKLLEGTRVVTDPIDGLVYEYASGEPNATLISGAPTGGIITIPTEIPNIGKKVIAIAPNAFQNCTNLKSLTLPASLESIGDNAFYGCTSISIIENHITTPFVISSNVFPDVPASLYVPKKEKYSEAANWKKNYTLYEGTHVVTDPIDGLVYEYASGEPNAILISGIPTDGNVTIPTEVPNTGKKVKTIAESAFVKNTTIVKLTISEGIEVIGSNAFKGCKNIKNVWLPTSLTTIGDNAFDGCNSIAYICTSTNGNPLEINSNVFSTYKATLFVPEEKMEAYHKKSETWGQFPIIREGLFVDAITKDKISYECFTTGTGDTFKQSAVLVKSTTATADVTIPSSVELEEGGAKYNVISIAESAFSNNTKLVNLTIPETIGSIGENAFNGCSNLAVIESNIVKPCKIESNVFSDYSATLYIPANSTVKDYSDNGWIFTDIHEGVRTEVTSEGLTYVYASEEKVATLTKGKPTEKTLIIPKIVPGTEVAVTKIAEAAFSGNTTIENLRFEEGVTLTSIGANAFKGCKNIKKIWLPASLTTIGAQAFDGCNSIAYICTTNGTPIAIDENVFSAYTAALYVPGMASYGDADTWKKFPIIREGLFVDAITKDKISYECFTTGSGETLKQSAVLVKSATATADVTIPASVELEEGGAKYNVTSIAESAFADNTKLANLTLSENIETIGDRAFNGCSNLVAITSKMAKPIDIKNREVFSDYSASLYIPVNNKVEDYTGKGWNFLNIYVGERKEITLDDGFTYVYSAGDKKAMLTKVKTTDKDFTIPGTTTIDDVEYKVTAIDKQVFKDNKKIVNLTISENIVNIGAGSFQNCTSLKKVDLPKTLEKIGDNAFDGCDGIAYVCSKNTKSIDLGSSTFSTAIKETARLFVPKGSISEYSAWKGYFANISEGELKVVADGDMTYYCVAGPNTATLVEAKTTDAEVTISNEVKYDNVAYIVTEIGDYAFSGISSLQKVVIGDSITTIGVGAFSNCSKLKEVVIPAGVTAIGDKAFEKCDRLTLVVSRIEKPFDISEDVFPQVSAKLNVPDGTKELYENAKGWNVFSTILQGDMKEAEVDGMTYQYVTGDKIATLMKGATKEKTLTIPTSVMIDGTSYEIKTIHESALANISTIESLYISEGIDSIADNAFVNCANLNKVSLPATLRKLGDNAFSKCDKIVHIETAMKTPISISENVFTETTYANATLYVPIGTAAQYAAAEVWKKFASKMLEGDLNEVTVEGMTYICVPNLKIAKLIKGPDRTKDVKIPSKIYTGGKSYYVVDIERSAFYGLSNLEKVIIPDSVKTIGMEAFKNCSKLNTVELPSTLQSIGEKAFENCSKLTLVVCASATPATIYENTFPANSMTINVPLGAKDVYEKADYWGSENYTIYDSMSSLSEGDETKEEAPATYQIITDDDSSSASVAIVDDVNVSGDFAIPDAVVHNGTEYPVTAIAPNTFENNMSLISVTIPSSINSIGESAFAGCSNLKSIIVNWTEPLDLSAPAATRGLMTRSGGSSIFEGVDKDNCVLYVPDGSVDAYKAAEVWKDFKNIKPISTASIRDLIINGMPFDVYDLQGRKVRQNVTTLKGLPSGIYIVNGKKVSVRR